MKTINNERKIQMKEYTRDDFELGQKVQLTNGYEGEDADELFTITDVMDRKFWIGDDNNRGWYVWANMIKPYEEKER